MKKMIGIIAAVDSEGKSFVPQEYVHAIELSGGMAIALPYTKEIENIDRFVGLCDGFLFVGGEDIHPSLYGEEKTDLCGNIQPLRDEFESLAFGRVFASKKPILGVCRGMQFLNVAMGGSLYQDINSSIQTKLVHRQEHPHTQPSHDISIMHGTPFYGVLEEDSIAINSWHHQAVKKLGEGLAVMAQAEDGIIEAIYMPGRRYFVGVQWHPERSFDVDAKSRKIFAHFLHCC